MHKLTLNACNCCAYYSMRACSLLLSLCMLCRIYTVCVEHPSIIFRVFISWPYCKLSLFHQCVLFLKNVEGNIDKIQKVDDNRIESSAKSKNPKPPARKGAAGTPEPQDLRGFGFFCFFGFYRCFFNSRVSDFGPHPHKEKNRNFKLENLISTENPRPLTTGKRLQNFRGARPTPTQSTNPQV